jgi:cyclophilin family peptidyl-prolyl cis-trans isomerase
MMRLLFALCAVTLLVIPAHGAQEARIDTSMGTIVIALDADKAPVTVANFVRYAREGHFNNTLFYRVVSGFVIQAGSYGADHNWRPYHKPVPLETAGGLHNVRGSVAMGREDKPTNSATAEFFIDLADTNAMGLDPKPADAPNTTGYAVFGHVTQGMDVVDAIAAVPVGGGKGPFPDKEPVKPVVIKKVTIATVPDAPPAPPASPLDAEPQTPPATPPSQ